MVHGSVGLAKRRFHGLMRPMKLKSSVRTSKKSASCKINDHTQIIAKVYHGHSMCPTAAPCLSEMTAVMSCWKINAFDDVPCRKEIRAFVQCAENFVSVSVSYECFKVAR